MRAPVIYLVDISECPDFNTMYELYDPCTVMFFFRNKVGVLLSILPELPMKRCPCNRRQTMILVQAYRKVEATLWALS